MPLLANVIISAAIAVTTFVGAYKYLPLHWLETAQQSHVLGSTITTIQGTDTLSSSRTVINTNFANLNTDKIEATQATLSSLSSVGTITTGVWNATPVGVAYNGTGTTSPTLNQIMFGNGASGLKVIGFGSSGQFLTSGGASVAPSWTTASIDTSLAYNWTGNHNFSATTLVKNLNASSTSANPIVLNGVSLNTPSTQGASSTVLFNDGSGNLKWESPSWTLIGSAGFMGATSTVTLAATSTAQNIHVVFDGSNITTCTNNQTRILINPNTTAGVGANYGYDLVISGVDGSASSQTALVANHNGATGASVYGTIDIMNVAAQRKFLVLNMAYSNSGAVAAGITGSAVFNDTTNQFKSIAVGFQGGTGVCAVAAGTVYVYASGI